ncbi:unnamed protein product [Dicrocoelium dendriticum]|nr:unnamed protein product [Dicrocoelium dendriticum]
MVVKSLVALLGVYLFFLTERLTILFQNTKSRRKMKRQWSASADHRRSHDHLDKDGKPNSLDQVTGGDQWAVKLDSPDATNNAMRANFSEGLNSSPDGSSSTPFEENRLCIRPTERPMNNARCEGHLNDNSHFRAVLSPSKDTGMKKKDSSDGAVHFWPTTIYNSAENETGTKDPNGSGAAPSLEKALLPPITPATSLESLSHVMNAHSTHVKVEQVIQDGKAINEVARISSHSTGSEAAHPHRDKPHGHHHGHSHDLSSVRAIAYTVIVGDGLHNFCDGIAVGAAFANSLRGGLSTSIAVLCHELPHELGDFAVLLHAGMSVKAALFYNFLSGLLCAVGAAIGLVLGQTENIDSWLFMLAAGMFVYIALVDMVSAFHHASLSLGSDALTI